jgi:cell division protein FtsN
LTGTPSPIPNPSSPNTPSPRPLSNGEIGGIVVGVIVVILIMIVFIVPLIVAAALKQPCRCNVQVVANDLDLDEEQLGNQAGDRPEHAELDPPEAD